MSTEYVERYSRHLLLKEIGGPGQKKLGAARVALVGAGGLGAPALLYLAAAGIGFIRIIDPDRVSLSNLQRQVIYRTADIGEEKAGAAAVAARALNPTLVIEARAIALDGGNAAGLLGDCDLVLDGSDSFATRHAVNAAVHRLGKILVSGAVGRWDGQIASFASGRQPVPGKPASPCYHCLVPAVPEEAEFCARDGIVGALTGVIGTLMALEAIKLITGAGESLIGRVMFLDALGMETRIANLPADPQCTVCGTAARSGVGVDDARQ